MPLTVLQLEAEGFTAIECTCKACGHIDSVAFDLIRQRVAHLDMRIETIGDLGKRMPCGNCGSRECTYQEVRKGDPPKLEIGARDDRMKMIAILKDSEPVHYVYDQAMADRYINDPEWREELRLSGVPLHLRRSR